MRITEEVCKSCVYFKKFRGYPFGECTNEEVFQFAEVKQDLKELANDAFVLMGNAIPVVGVKFGCSKFMARGSKKPDSLTTTSDFKTERSNFVPEARKKRTMNKRVVIKRDHPPIHEEGEPYPKRISEKPIRITSTIASSDSSIKWIKGTDSPAGLDEIIDEPEEQPQKTREK